MTCASDKKRRASGSPQEPFEANASPHDGKYNDLLSIRATQISRTSSFRGIVLLSIVLVLILSQRRSTHALSGHYIISSGE